MPRQPERRVVLMTEYKIKLDEVSKYYNGNLFLKKLVLFSKLRKATWLQVPMDLESPPSCALSVDCSVPALVKCRSGQKAG